MDKGNNFNFTQESEAEMQQGERQNSLFEGMTFDFNTEENNNEENGNEIFDFGGAINSSTAASVGSNDTSETFDFGSNISFDFDDKSDPVDSYMKDILHFLKDNNLALAKIMIKDEIIRDYNARVDKEGNRLIHYAVKYGNKDIVGLLVCEKNVDVNIKNDNGDTPLYVVLKNKMYEKAEMLLGSGANIFEKNNKGRTPLDLLQTNLNKEEDFFQFCLWNAFKLCIDENDLKAAQRLIDAGLHWDSDWVTDWFCDGDGGLKEVCLKRVKFFIKNGLESELLVPILFALLYYHESNDDLIDICTYLIKKGVSFISYLGAGSVFHWVVSYKQLKFVIDNGAYIFINTELEFTGIIGVPMEFFLHESYSFAYVKLLVLNGATLSQKAQAGLGNSLEEMYVKKALNFKRLSKEEKFKIVFKLLRKWDSNNKEKQGNKELYFKLLLSELVFKLADLFDKKDFEVLDYKNTVLYKLFTGDVKTKFINAVKQIFKVDNLDGVEAEESFEVFLGKTFRAMLKNKHEISKMALEKALSVVKANYDEKGRIYFLRNGYYPGKQELETKLEIYNGEKFSVLKLFLRK